MNPKVREESCITTRKMYEFIVDTDSYAGSFINPLAAFMTGETAGNVRLDKYALCFKDMHPDISLSGIIRINTGGDYGDSLCEMRGSPSNPQKCIKRSASCKPLNICDSECKCASRSRFTSVGIFFKQDPILYYSILKAQAYKFPDIYTKDRVDVDRIKILGFRLLVTTDVITFI